MHIRAGVESFGAQSERVEILFELIACPPIRFFNGVITPETTVDIVSIDRVVAKTPVCVRGGRLRGPMPLVHGKTDSRYTKRKR